MLTLTQNAQEMLQKVMDSAKKPVTGLRIAAAPGGCSGIQYRLALVEGPEVGDHIVEAGCIKLYIVPENAEVLIGTTIDYVETEKGSGFSFDNPNSKSMCSACAASTNCAA